VPAPRELFISHASSDKHFVDRLIKVLARHRIRFWYSRSHLVGAQQWHDEIGEALRRCDWFLVILSPAATRSMWLKRELRYALDAKRFDGRIIPVLLRQYDHARLSWTLDSIQGIDFTTDFDLGCATLFRVWKRAYTPDDLTRNRRR
jgi:hypothetical protein